MKKLLIILSTILLSTETFCAQVICRTGKGLTLKNATRKAQSDINRVIRKKYALQPPTITHTQRGAKIEVSICVSVNDSPKKPN